jgi:hypothetical protein
MNVSNFEGVYLHAIKFKHTTKQIYDKHKAIWWAQVNARKTITHYDFIWQNDIAYFINRKPPFFNQFFSTT